MKSGETIGITGENGAGKTTLVTILAGEMAADNGRIIISGQTAPNGIPNPQVGLVHQHPKLMPGRPVWESLVIGNPDIQLFGRRHIIGQLGKQLEDLHIEIPLTATPDRLTQGQLHLAELAAVLLRKPKLLILDEPTAACSADESQSILEILSKIKNTALIYISHRYSEITKLCHRVYQIEKGSLKEISPDDLKPIAHRFHSRIGSIHQQLPPVLRVENISSESSNLGKLANISFQVIPGEILGGHGYRDHGLLLLEDVLCGKHQPQSGSLYMFNKEIKTQAQARKSGLRYIPSQRFKRGLAMQMPLIDSLREHILLRHPDSVWAGIWRPGRLRDYSDRILQRMKIQQNIQQPLENLSGGMRQRTLIARETDVDDASMACALICEPTIGLDQSGCNQLWESLRELASRGAGIVILSSNPEEISPFCNRMLLLHNGKLEAADE